MRNTLITIFLFFPTFLLSQINHNLYSPFLELPLIGEDETMHFGFWLYANMPDSDGDNDTFLDDYYRVAIRSLEASSWHISNYNSISGSNFWCSDEEGIGGYKDGWLQFLDTPNILIGESGNIHVDIFYAIEDYFDASVDGSCTDGWDVANVRISIDDGLSWELLSDEDNPYDFQCGYGWIWNDSEYEEGRSLNHLASGWGGKSEG